MKDHLSQCLLYVLPDETENGCLFRRSSTTSPRKRGKETKYVDLSSRGKRFTRHLVFRSQDFDLPTPPFPQSWDLGRTLGPSRPTRSRVLRGYVSTLTPLL